jgi:ribosome-binding protein aMBF1 (putative translation factor)
VGLVADRDRLTLSALVAHSVAPRLLDIHVDDCEDDACTGCDPQHLAEKAAVKPTARQDIAAHLWMCVPSADDYEAKARTEQMLDAYRAEVQAEVADWLVKKAREYHGLRGKENAARVEVLCRMADKIRRGAVRPTATAKSEAGGSRG